MIADTVQRSEQGKQLSIRYLQQLTAVNTSPLPVKVLFVMNHGGMTPLAAGQHTAADAVITAAGLKNAMQGFERYRPLSQEGVIASAPDLLLITTDSVRSIGGWQQLWSLPGLALTPAGKNRRVLIVDDMALLGFGLEMPATLAKLRQAAEQSNAQPPFPSVGYRRPTGVADFAGIGRRQYGGIDIVIPHPVA